MPTTPTTDTEPTTEEGMNKMSARKRMKASEKMLPVVVDGLRTLAKPGVTFTPEQRAMIRGIRGRNAFVVNRNVGKV